MLPTGTLPVSRTDGAVCCAVAAHATLDVPLNALSELRKPTNPLTGQPLAPAFLKNADEQTVAGLAAVFAAVRTSGLRGHDLSGWGVIAAPRFLGRGVMGHVLHRFREEGAWGISPHVIPHRSLHALSGTVSQALKLFGPNFGAGGGPGAESEALLAAATLLSDRGLPGVWVVPSRSPRIPRLPPLPALPPRVGEGWGGGARRPCASPWRWP